jgi:hypothetical protein
MEKSPLVLSGPAWPDTVSVGGMQEGTQTDLVCCVTFGLAGTPGGVVVARGLVDLGGAPAGPETTGRVRVDLASASVELRLAAERQGAESLNLYLKVEASPERRWIRLIGIRTLGPVTGTSLDGIRPTVS